MKKLKTIKLSENSEMLNDFQMKNILGGSNWGPCTSSDNPCMIGVACTAPGTVNGKCGWEVSSGNTYCRCISQN